MAYLYRYPLARGLAHLADLVEDNPDFYEVLADRIEVGTAADPDLNAQWDLAWLLRVAYLQQVAYDAKELPKEFAEAHLQDLHDLDTGVYK